MKPLALVVENDGGTRKLLDVVLSRAGLEADVVGGSADAILLLEKLDYDIIFLDLLFPGGSGEDVLRWLARHRPDGLKRATVLSSAPDYMLDRVRRDWSPVRVMRKPFDVVELARVAEDAAIPRPRPVTRAEKFCRRSVCAGAKAGIVVRRSGDIVQLVSAFGYPPGVAEAWYPMPLSSPYPLCASMRTARPVWLASLTLAQPEYPQLAPVWHELQSRALAVVPVLRDGNVIGAAGWSFREPRLFNDEEQRALATVAELASQIIDDNDQSVSHTGA